MFIVLLLIIHLYNFSLVSLNLFYVDYNFNFIFITRIKKNVDFIRILILRNSLTWQN